MNVEGGRSGERSLVRVKSSSSAASHQDVTLFVTVNSKYIHIIYKCEGKYPKKCLKELELVTSGEKNSADTVFLFINLIELLHFSKHVPIKLVKF